ncbi:hypothetical protein [Rhizobium leguminosarum]|uniref:hypothetical protein n=1 Tax=Rhizobium leguminosarum TaxID=384 RepID=UPI001031B85E|nr:hypothetical protein [Rhizobium leguminosarum]TBF75774.1 hypothetical protein ELG84_24115 [Rhizobium leguminosarum]
MADLKEFLTKLAQDPDLKAQYDDDPENTMIQANLPEGARQAVLTGDRAQIAQHLGPSGTQAFGVSVNVTITLGITIP